MQSNRIDIGINELLQCNMSLATNKDCRPSFPVALNWLKPEKRYAAFITHHKVACAMEARFLKDELSRALNKDVFLDSDDLFDLSMLLNNVREAQVLVVLQSKEVFHRPWCLLEVWTAIEAGIPVVAVNVEG